MSRRTPYQAAIALFIVWCLLSSPAWAIDVQELKQHQKLVRQLVDKVLPATVCIQTSNGDGSGSGVVVNKEGLILTAGHVTMAIGEELTVLFPDGKKVRAKRLGVSGTRDAAMAQIIDKGKYPFVELGESGELKRNDWCIAIGHAGGFDAKRTPPIRIGRVIANHKWIVTDCALIGGDSGGPLFDQQGLLIGIHSNIGASLTQNQHVPIDIFSRNWKRMIQGDTWGSLEGDAKGGDQRPVLGIRLHPSPHDDGVGLEMVIPGSPAAEVGIQAGDIVVSVNQHIVRSPEDIMALVQEKKLEHELKIEVQRDGKVLEFSVKPIPASELMAMARELEDSELEKLELTRRS
ncbi:MAG: S1C family serine protease, partial [Planctomycetales bacterium]